MAGEKYVIATSDNSLQVLLRNILNPVGYIFLGNCSDAVSLLRLVKGYSPDFAVVDMSLQSKELRNTLEIIDSEMLCACIAVGDYKDLDMGDMLEKYKTLFSCHKPINKEMLINIVEMAVINYKRVFQLDRKLKEMTENYETRKAVERAKWILIERDGISENDAYEKIRKKSMDTRLSMKAIADALIFTYEIGGKK